MEIKTERIEMAAGDGARMGGFLAVPTDGGPHPGVIVFMEIFGINSHIREVTERVAREGYVALAPDYFHRTGPGIELGYDDEGMARGMELLGSLKGDEMIADAQTAIGYLAGRSDIARDRIGCMGFCIGGHMAYLAACETDVKATASFYGGGIAAPTAPGGAPSTIGRTGKISGRILCLFGGKDAMIPRDQVDAVAEKLRQERVSHNIITYEDADHGFFCDQRATYNAEAAADAWKQVTALFAESLVR
jgi:carboxymethylenebutenolidase